MNVPALHPDIAAQPLLSNAHLEDMLQRLYREFGGAGAPGKPLVGVSLCLSYLGRDSVVATLGAFGAAQAHGLEAAIAHTRMAHETAADPRVTALLDKASRLLVMASHLKSGGLFENATRH